MVSSILPKNEQKQFDLRYQSTVRSTFFVFFFVFWKNWRHQKVLLKFMFLSLSILQKCAVHSAYCQLQVLSKALHFFEEFIHSRPLNVAYSQNLFSLWSRSQNNIEKSLSSTFQPEVGRYKGQLISKGLFGVIVWTKKPTKFFLRFLP